MTRRRITAIVAAALLALGAGLSAASVAGTGGTASASAPASFYHG